MRPHILRNIDLATLGNLKKFLNLQVTIQNERSWSPRAISPISCVATPNTRERSRNAINCPACTSQSMSKFVARMFFSSQVFDVAAGPSGISVSGRCGSLRQLRQTTEIYAFIRKRSFPPGHNCVGKVLCHDLSIGERTMDTFQKCQLSNGIQRFVLTFDGIDHLSQVLSVEC